VERYEPVRRRKEKELQELVDSGCCLQFNIDSFLDRGTRFCMMKYYHRGWVDFVGSDCHNLKARPPRFDEFQKMMKKKTKCEYLQEWSL
jgi:protein-tyrosine phosphatase